MCTPPPNTTGFSKKAGTTTSPRSTWARARPDKYQTVGRIDSTDWRTGQTRTDVPVIVCTHIQIVYSGVAITSPSTCAQTTFS
jgi:hypothetical protein